MKQATLKIICEEIIKKGDPGLGINKLSLSEETAANVPYHIEDYSNEYPQPFTEPRPVKIKKKKQRRPLATEIVG